MSTYNLEDAPPDVQAYNISELDAAKYDMYKGEVYKNSLGYKYIVLEDSPRGKIEVKVYFPFSLGRAWRQVPKVVLIS